MLAPNVMTSRSRKPQPPAPLEEKVRLMLKNNAAALLQIGSDWQRVPARERFMALRTARAIERMLRRM